MIQPQQESPTCSIAVENVWGPQVRGCGQDFDLTLLFQETVLFIGPLSFSILLSTIRLWQLIRRHVIVASPVLHGFKLGSYVMLILLQAALLAVQITLRNSLTRASVAASILGIAGAIILLLTSHLEHGRSVRASTVLVLYLGYSTVADALRARTLWSMPENTPVAVIQTAFFALKCIVFLLELRHKEVDTGVCSPTPDEQASIISRLFIWWLLPLLRSGQQKTRLTSESLPDIEQILTGAGDVKTPNNEKPSSASGREWADELFESSIFRHIFAVRGWLILSAVPPRLAYTGFLFAQPFLINKATDWLAAPLNDNTYKIGGSLIAAYVIVYVGLGTSQAFYRHCTARSITAIRADLVSKIHNHSLKLSASSSAQDSASTLMSADVERFVTGTRNMHEAWASPIELGIGLFILESQIGLATAAAGGLTVVFVGLTGLVASSAGKRQNEWLKGMETRIVGTTQALKAMKGIKMTGVSSVVRRDILALRRAEVRRMRKFRQVMVVVLWSMFIPVIMGPILAFTVYNVYVGPKTGVVLTPAMVYQVLTILGIFGNNIAQLLESSVNIVTAGASLMRIQAFLLGNNTREDKRALLPARNSRLATEDDDEEPLLPRPQPHITAIRLNSMQRRISNNPTTLRLVRASAGWSTDGPMVVNNANFEASSPSVVAVVGPTGSGKTTLLQMLLGETEHSEGIVGITSRHIGYCSQTPWLTQASIRDNIVSSGVFEECWYNTVLHASALHKDINMMAGGDGTVIGNAGSNLSGGQKKRVALARAVYSRAPIFILDDPFSGLDGRTENEVLEALFGPQGLLRRHPALVVWATSTAKQVKFADHIITLTDSGDIRKRDSLLATTRETNASWLDEESGDEGENWTANAKRLSTIEVIGGLVVERDHQPYSSTKDSVQTPARDPTAYRYYIGGGGKRKFLAFLVMISVFIGASLVWAVKWAQNNILDPNRLQRFYIGVYFAVGALQLIAWSAAGLFFIFAIAEKAADRCHAALLDTVLCAPMSFFDSTAAGKTINRFSQDLQLIDTELPYNLLGAVTQFLGAIGQCGIIIYGAPWSGLAIPVVAAAVYWLQRMYLPTSRQLRLLEIEAKAPLFSQFLEALSGLPTIRAMRLQATYRRKNQAAVKASQKPFFLLFAAQNWLNLVLDLITAGLAVIIISIGVATRSQANSMLGLALFGASSFSASAKYVIQHWTELEISMGAIERVRAFTMETASERNVEAESSSGSSGLQLAAVVTGNHKAWSGQGRITFIDVSARYTPSLPLALHKISFDIQPGRRYAICGRTGSGKSSLLGALLRLIPLEKGQILVDDVDITTTNPDAVRSRFITLPQDPVLIGGTVRHNLQLYGRHYTDEDMAAALDAFGLWDVIQQKGGLNVDMSDELLSHGQRQLFCFARSTLEKGKNIVILDEPSSQADRATEQKIEDAIRNRFKRHTVLCIAHKLSTILSFDTVLTMDNGVIAERGSPRALLEDRKSLFAALMQSQRQQEQDAITPINQDIDPSNEVQGTKLILIHLSICLCTFLVGLDFNLIATAVPVITSEFNSTRDIGWYGAAFMVALCATQPLAGKMYTLFPKKLTYLLYVFFFELGSLVCALAPSSRALIAGRVIAGFGASGIFAGGFTILTTIIPLHKRAVWTGIMGSTFSIASIVGPVLGGALTQNVTWRWCFYINLPIGGASAAIFFFLVHLKPASTELQPIREKLRSIDAPGLVLFAGSITILLLALQWGGVEFAWSSSVTIGLFVGFGVVFILFVGWIIYRGDGGLIPPRIFTVNRNPALLCAAAFFVNGPFQIIIYWLSVWFQGVLQNSPTASGVNFFPTVIADVLAAFIGSALASQLGWWNPFVILGAITVSIGSGLLTTIYPNVSGGHWVGYQILGGVGYSLSSNLSHLAMQTSLPQDLVPLGASTLLSIISTSCAIFMAIGQAVFQQQLQRNLGAVISEDSLNHIIDSGVTDLSSLVDPSVLREVVDKYSLSVTQVFYIPAVAPVISFFLILGCKWISTKSKQGPEAIEKADAAQTNV